MAESQPRSAKVMFADLDGTRLGPRSDQFGRKDLAAWFMLRECGIRPIDVTDRNASRMNEVWEQEGRGDAILGGGTTFYLNGVEAVEHRIWLPSDVSTELVDRVTRVRKGTKAALARFVGYNGRPMTSVHKKLLRDQPAESSPVVCFTLDADPRSRERVEEAIADVEAEGLLIEVSPYRDREDLHYAKIALANKKIGVRKYQEINGLQSDECAAIGNDEPDAGMLALACSGLRFAVANSTPRFLALAEECGYQLVGSVDEQGFSQAAEMTVAYNRTLLA